MKYVLVTGGAGFLGSHLCERLLNMGDHVVCLDNFYTSQRSNVAHLLGHPDFRLVDADVRKPIVMGVDEIYNLACPAAPGHYQHDPVYTLTTSVQGALEVLGLANRCKAKVLQASTSEIYGDPEVHPQYENYWGYVNSIGPRSCYDEGKRAAETLFMDNYRMYGTRIKIARIFNTYGPRMHPYDGRVVSNFIRQALNNEPITIYGDGNQTRSFCYRDDLVEGLIRLMATDDDCVGPINLGNPGEFTIAALAEKVLRLTGSDSAVLWKPKPIDDPCRRKPDITLARAALGWTPTVDLVEGLSHTIQWFKSINLADYTPPTPNY